MCVYENICMRVYVCMYVMLCMYVLLCTVCGSEYFNCAVVLLVVELEADFSPDLLPLRRGDVVHHVHQNRVEDGQAQRLRSMQCNVI